MITPQRVQRRRTPGWRMPPDTVYVGRPGPWGNRCAAPTLAASVAAYEQQMRAQLAARPHLLQPLRGKHLACWCKLDQVCHADVLLRLANEEKL